MFELDAEVRRWRTGLERESSLSTRELDELEDHLRARVDLELELDAALTPARALAVAVKALGEPQAISTEFARAGRPRWRRLLLAGWALYTAAFLLPAYGYSSRQDVDLTTYGYDIFPDLIQLTTGGTAWAVGVLWLPNLIMLMTLPTFRRLRRSRRGWTAWIIGATGALPLGLGLLRLGDPGPFHLEVGFWVWSASFVLVALALWLRSREWASARMDNAATPVSKLGVSRELNRV